MNNHPDPEVRSLITRLTDALCTWERATGRENVLIIREAGFSWRALNGKPNVPVDLEDELLLAGFS